MARHVAQLWQQGIRSAHRLDEQTHGWLGLLAGAAKETLRPASGITAAAIAYYALFSLFPVILLTIAIASFSLGPAMEQQLTVEKLEFYAPALGQLLGPNIDEIVRARGPASSVALVGLIWSASTVFQTVTLTLDGIWGIKRRRPVWKRRGLAMILVLAFVGSTLFLASLAGSMISSLRPWLPDQIVPIGGGISLALAILLDVASFMVLYMLLPHGAATWREILPGAIGAGLLWELAKKAFLFFVSTYISMSNLVYGSVAAIIAFLTWAYLSSLTFLFGAYFSVSYYRLRQQQREAAGPNTSGTLMKRMADPSTCNSGHMDGRQPTATEQGAQKAAPPQ
jgi:membrane protein